MRLLIENKSRLLDLLEQRKEDIEEIYRLDRNIDLIDREIKFLRVEIAIEEVNLRRVARKEE